MNKSLTSSKFDNYKSYVALLVSWFVGSLIYIFFQIVLAVPALNAYAVLFLQSRVEQESADTFLYILILSNIALIITFAMRKRLAGVILCMTLLSLPILAKLFILPMSDINEKNKLKHEVVIEQGDFRQLLKELSLEKVQYKDANKLLVESLSSEDRRLEILEFIVNGKKMTNKEKLLLTDFVISKIKDARFIPFIESNIKENIGKDFNNMGKNEYLEERGLLILSLKALKAYNSKGALETLRELSQYVDRQSINQEIKVMIQEIIDL